MKGLRKVGLLCLCGGVAVLATLPAGAGPPRHGAAYRDATSRGAVYRIAGTVLGKIDLKPLAGLTVKVFDEELTGERPVATALTNALGQYAVTIKRSALPERLRARGEAQKLFLQIFNGAGQLIKSPERHVEVSPGTGARVDIRLLDSEVNPDTPLAVCGFGNEEGLSALAAKLSSGEVVEAFTSLRAETPELERLSTGQRALVQLLSQGDAAGDCAEGFFSSIASLLERRGDSRLVAQLAEAFRPPLDKKFFTENFRVLYTTSGKNGVDPYVPTADSPLLLPNGELVGRIRANLSDLPGNKEVAPVYVQQVALIAEHARRRFVAEPFNLRDPLGDATQFDIIIQPLGAAGAADPHPSANYILIHNRNSLDQNFATVPHELFHRVQYRYNRTADRSGLYGIMREGGARLIEDSFNDDYNRYVYQSQEIFRDPTQSLATPPGSCQTPINYAAGLFWKYLAEQHSKNTYCADEPHIGVDTYRQMLVTTATAAGGAIRPYAPAALRTACALMARPGSFDEFRYFDEAKTELASHETIWGNYLIANHVHRDEASPPGERRFRYLEDQDVVTWPLTTRELPERIRKLATLGAMINLEDDVMLGRGGSISRTVIGQLQYAARYYRIKPRAGSPPRALRVSVSAFGGMSDPLIQVLRFGADGVLRDISRSDRPAYTKTVNMSGLSSVVVIVASRMGAGDFTVSFDEVPGGPDVMVTRWNSAVLTEYEADPRDSLRTRTSPDLMVDTNGDLVPDGAAYPGVDNKLKVRAHNRGRARADGVSITLAYQSPTYRNNVLRLDPTRWLPVRNAANVEQAVTGLALAPAGNAGDERWVAVDWAPAAAGSNNGWCVKVTVSAPGDSNVDNKTAIGCFPQAGVAPARASRLSAGAGGR